MAMATLCHFFHNPALFAAGVGARGGNKIRRGTSLLLMERCGSFDDVKQAYLELALSLARRNAARCGPARDAWPGEAQAGELGAGTPGSFIAIGGACAAIVRWVHEHDARTARPGGTRRGAGGALAGGGWAPLLGAALVVAAVAAAILLISPNSPLA